LLGQISGFSWDPGLPPPEAPGPVCGFSCDTCLQLPNCKGRPPDFHGDPGIPPPEAKPILVVGNVGGRPWTFPHNFQDMWESSQWQASNGRGLEGEIAFGSFAHVVLEIVLRAKPELRRTTWFDIVCLFATFGSVGNIKAANIRFFWVTKRSCPPLPSAFGILSLSFFSLSLSLSLSSRLSRLSSQGLEGSEGLQPPSSQQASQHTGSLASLQTSPTRWLAISMAWIWGEGINGISISYIPSRPCPL